MVGRGIMFSKGELLNHGTSKVSSFRGSQAPGSAPARTSGEQKKGTCGRWILVRKVTNGMRLTGTYWNLPLKSTDIPSLSPPPSQHIQNWFKERSAGHPSDADRFGEVFHQPQFKHLRVQEGGSCSSGETNCIFESLWKHNIAGKQLEYTINTSCIFSFNFNLQVFPPSGPSPPFEMP